VCLGLPAGVELGDQTELVDQIATVAIPSAASEQVRQPA
jgi:hypothetical protein